MNLLQQQDTKYKLIIFDFDGTIADSSEGILDAHRYTLEYFGKSVKTDEELRTFIGGNLLEIYNNEMEFSIEQARMAVNVYRKRYAESGIEKIKLYPGFISLLNLLKENNYIIGIATLKADKFIHTIINNLEMGKYFDIVFGMNDRDDLRKSDLINLCLQKCEVERERTLFVGDSYGDYIGALESKVDFVGVSYGFGLKKEEKYDFCMIDTPEELVEIINTR